MTGAQPWEVGRYTVEDVVIIIAAGLIAGVCAGWLLVLNGVV